jgi:Flp pilus assembly protein TadG
LKLIHKKNGEKGQALAEFALIIPIFLILVFAIVDFGMGFHSWISISNGAREGARLGAVSGTQQQIIDRVHEVTNTLDPAKETITVTNAGGASGTSVTVEVDYDYALITPISSIMGLVSGGSLGTNLNLSSTAEMRIE